MKRQLVILLSACLVFILAYTIHADKSHHQKNWKDLFIERSLLNHGDTARIQHVMDKARNGQNIVIGVIGGSITKGVAAGKEEDRWANRLHKWWIDMFPKSNISFINAGISGTGSLYGAHRVYRDLLRHKPDFVVVEFAVNDSNAKSSAETLEGLVRQILKQPNNPALMLFFTTYRNGNSAEKWHSKVGNYYNLPMISYRSAIFPEIEAGRFTWEEISSDVVHPNTRGHQYCAELITTYLINVFNNMPNAGNLPAISQIPEPMISDVFEYTSIYQQSDIKAVNNTGWYEFGNAWKTDHPGSEIVFMISGRIISVLFMQSQGDMGVAEVSVDDNPPVRIDGQYDKPWNHQATNIVASDLKLEKHQVKIRTIDEKRKSSNGYRFEIKAILAAGLGDEK